MSQSKSYFIVTQALTEATNRQKTSLKQEEKKIHVITNAMFQDKQNLDTIKDGFFSSRQKRNLKDKNVFCNRQRTLIPVGGRSIAIERH